MTLELLQAAADRRIAGQANGPAATDMYHEISRDSALEPAARAIIEAMAAHVRSAAIETETLAREDPAHPGLECAYTHLLAELSALATIFEPRTAAYEDTNACIGRLMAAGAAAGPVWQLIRAGLTERARRRALPPPGRHNGRR
jgi:hypothetical protein